jgi:hypothetical protein
MYRKRKYPNQQIHLFFTRGTSIGKTFTFFFIQGLLKHYNKRFCYDLLKQKKILMAYTSKTIINIDGIIIHFGLSLPLNCKHLQSLSLERLNSLSKTYEQ